MDGHLEEVIINYVCFSQEVFGPSLTALIDCIPAGSISLFDGRDVSLQDKPQRGLWDRAKDALCSLPPIELTFGADAFLGVGASGALGGSLDLSTGQLRFVASSALGVGGGGGVGGAFGFVDRTSGASFSSNVTGGYAVTGTLTRSTDSFTNGAVSDSFRGASYRWRARAGLWGNQQIKYTSPPTPALYKGC